MNLPPFLSPEDLHPGVLSRQWPTIQQRWEQPLWQILLPVVNHGTHHRGQVSGFLRAMGRPGLIAFYREL